MNLRLVELFLPKDQEERVKNLLAAHSFLGFWEVPLSEEQLLLKILLDKSQVEPVVEHLIKEFKSLDNFQLLLLSVEASLPRAKPDSISSDSEPKLKTTDARISKEEIYNRVAASIQFSWTQIVLIILACAIAAIGIVRGSEAVIIGAMVIAPIFKPNMALAVSTTLGDGSLALRTIKVGLTGILVAVVFSLCLGVLYPLDLSMPEVALRTKVSLTDVVLAFASGAAGAISLTIGERSAVVGVMVAVALLPPLVTFGMLLSSALWQPALGSLLLFLINITCLNLAAIATLWLQNVRPYEWWQQLKAKKMTNFASLFWLLLFCALISFIFMLEFRYQSSLP
ncbi:TIGR00341 family protein [Pleurocapsales cyanobacterium LEGE 06147]|nr:TIGR00341 family protein [Pleurocapsales cyanobacterium LEGE 06147]